MRAREWVFVLASAWVGAVAFCTGVRMLFGCAPAGQVHIPVKDFQWRVHSRMHGAALAALAALEAKMRVEKTQLQLAQANMSQANTQHNNTQRGRR